MLTPKGDSLNNYAFPAEKKHVFLDAARRSWDQKSPKNQSKNGTQDGMHLGTDFSTILVDLGGQDGAMLALVSHTEGILC